MSAYFIIMAVFVLLGGYVFAAYRWWFRHLKALAGRYDIPERRKRAAKRYFVFLVFVVVPVLTVVIGSVVIAPETGSFNVLAFICSIAPAIIWWFRQMPTLCALGYGHERS
jgi:hypothetical protein